MTYDPMVLSVDVAVTDAGGGVLNATPDYPADTTFNNTYRASGNVTLRALKVLSAGGRDLETGEFTFELRNGAGTLLQSKTNAADGSIVFDPIPYTEADIGQTYTYTIREVVPGSPETGMTYDPMVPECGCGRDGCRQRRPDHNPGLPGGHDVQQHVQSIRQRDAPLG